MTDEFRKRLLEVVRRRPRSLGLEFLMWILQRLAGFLAEDTGPCISTEIIQRVLAKTHYDLGAVNYHSEETAVIIRRRRRLLEVADLPHARVDKDPTGTFYVA